MRIGIPHFFSPLPLMIPIPFNLQDLLPSQERIYQFQHTGFSTAAIPWYPNQKGQIASLIKRIAGNPFLIHLIGNNDQTPCHTGKNKVLQNGIFYFNKIQAIPQEIQVRLPRSVEKDKITQIRDIPYHIKQQIFISFQSEINKKDRNKGHHPCIPSWHGRD